MFQKIAKHRANDASNDVHRPPLPSSAQSESSSSEIVLLKMVTRGRAPSCEGSEVHTIDQACILGGPAQFITWARLPWNLVRAIAILWQ